MCAVHREEAIVLYCVCLQATRTKASQGRRGTVSPLPILDGLGPDSRKCLSRLCRGASVCGFPFDSLNKITPLLLFFPVFFFFLFFRFLQGKGTTFVVYNDAKLRIFRSDTGGLVVQTKANEVVPV